MYQINKYLRIIDIQVDTLVNIEYKISYRGYLSYIIDMFIYLKGFSINLINNVDD